MFKLKMAVQANRAGFGDAGIEPATLSSQVRCSTTELIHVCTIHEYSQFLQRTNDNRSSDKCVSHLSHIPKSGRWDLNPQPLSYDQCSSM